MHDYVILLRGINVGGNNIIKMTDLRSSLEIAGFVHVETYIQSGNVIVRSKESSAETVQRKIASRLKKDFDYTNPILCLSKKRYISACTSRPTWFGKDVKKYKYDVLFTISPLTPSTLLKDLELRDGVDKADKGIGAFFFRRLGAKSNQSKLSKIASSPHYKNITIRNWNTTKKLLDMIEERT